MNRALDLSCFRDPGRAFLVATFRSHVSDVNKMEKENGRNDHSQ
jgi:hypothetical protein